jgi:hypothetical protein
LAENINTKVPEVNFPDIILIRMEKADEGAPEEGTKIALELVE